MSDTRIIKAGNGKYIAKLALTLFAITAIVALLLGGVNALTVDRINELAEQTRQDAMSAVMPDAGTFSQLEFETTEGVVTINGAFNGTALVGYCVEVESNGFGGAIDIMVGVDLNGVCTGASILDQSETPGLGTKAAEPAFIDQYIGRSGTITVKTGASSDITAITGATITSRAVTKGINLALSAAAGMN